MPTNAQLVLARRPHGMLADGDVELVEASAPSPGPGEYLVEVSHLSIDPTIRTWMDDAPGYLPAIEIDQVIRSGGIGTVVESNDEAHPVGTKVFGMVGWQRYTLGDAGFSAIPDGVDPLLVINVLGITGMTAYFGIHDVLSVREGDVVVVSGAAGATGSVAGQLAKAAGASKVIGIAGGPEKCRLLTEEIGYDAAIDYRAGDVSAQLAKLAPEGIDAYFDNVGGECLEAALANLKIGARIALCGAISRYTATELAGGPANYLMLIVKRATMQGFLVLDYAARFGEAQGVLLGMLLEGKLWHAEHVVEGLERAPEALNLLFTGGNTGKVVVAL